jgi:hypothetical protein
MHVDKAIDLRLLQEELAAVGIVVPGLGFSGDNIHTYDPGGAIVDLPPEAAPVVDAHVAPPLVVEYVETRTVSAVTRTTDAAFHEVWRLTTKPKHVYRAKFELRATDASDGTTKAQEAVLVFKGTAASPVQVGATTVLWAAQDAAATGWAIQAQVQGQDLVFGARGAAGKTVDWSLTGAVAAFGPEGLG